MDESKVIVLIAVIILITFAAHQLITAIIELMRERDEARAEIYRLGRWQANFMSDTHHKVLSQMRELVEGAWLAGHDFPEDATIERPSREELKKWARTYADEALK